MPRLPVLSAREILNALRGAGIRSGFAAGESFQVEASYRIGYAHCDCSDHPEVPRGILVPILGQAGLSREEFSRFL